MIHSRFYRDLERCPYTWGTPEQIAWLKKDQERLAAIDEHRKELLVCAKLPAYMHHKNPIIREMSQFVIELLDRE